MVLTANLPITLAYKTVDDVTCYIDVYLPQPNSVANRDHSRSLPIILYFHGGGLCVGNRKSWFPQWIHDRALQAGYAFISADHRLMPPATGHDVLEDICDLFAYLASPSGANADLAETAKTGYQLDATSIIASGSSAGGWCAYMAARHATPRPKGVLSMYGTGGNFLTAQYLQVHKTPFFMGREMLDPLDFVSLLYPFPPDLLATADSPLAYHPSDHPTTPGWPANPRMQLCRLYIQEAVYLDYITGEHSPSLSGRLAMALGARGLLRLRDSSDLETKTETATDPSAVADLTETEAIISVAQQVIPERSSRLFPQLIVDQNFPPVFFLHGEKDSVVHLRESQTMKHLLDRAGILNEIRVAKGAEHSFDYAKGATEQFAEHMDDAFVFIGKLLASN